MKRNERSLYCAELLNLFNINKALHDPRGKGRAVLTIAGLLALGLLFSVYVFLYGWMMGLAGMGDMILPMAMCINCFITFFTTAYKSGGTVFAGRDLQMLLSMPVRTSAIVGSRIFPLYVMDLLTSLIIMIPALIMQLYFTGGEIMLVVTWLITLPVLPLIPLVLAMFLGAIITWISVRFRFKNLLTILFTMVYVVAILAYSMNSSNFTSEGIANTSTALMSTFQRIYPPTVLYTQGVCQGNLLALLGFLALSLGVCTVCLKLMGSRYQEISSRLTAQQTRKAYKAKELKISGPFMALYKREWKRYLSSTIYVTNTAIGLVMPLIAGVALVVMGQDKLLALLEMPGARTMLIPFIPYGICFMSNMCCTTAAALSMEGRHLYLLKSFPVPTKLIWDAMIAVNVTLNLPPLLVCAVLFGIGLKLSILETIWCFLLPAAFTLFVSVLGMFLNILMPRLDWTNEAQIVKQSGPIFCVVMGSMVVMGLLLVPVAFVPVNKNIIHLCVTLVVLLLTWLFYREVCRKKLPDNA